MERGWRILIDKGAGGEEAARVEAAIAGLPPDRVQCWEGAFAPFAAGDRRGAGCISGMIPPDSTSRRPAASRWSRCSPDSHLRRMFARWRPTGAGPIEVVRVDDPDPVETLERTLQAVDDLATDMA